MGRDDDIHDTTSKRYKAMKASHAKYRKQKAAAKAKAKKSAKPSKATRPAKAKKTNKSKKRK